MHSGLYTGSVWHRRRTPVEHAFTSSLFMLYLDLSELDRVFAGRWLWSTRRRALVRFDERDHLGRGQLPVGEVVRRTVSERTGFRPAGPIRLLTQPRYAGYAFNPVSFYYCFDEADEEVVALVADVTNTPWGERHTYVLPRSGQDASAGLCWSTPKEFHVSPFMGMDVNYRWSFERPGPSLRAHIENVDRDGVLVFEATLSLSRREITSASLARSLALHPFLGLRTTFHIYWQALRLWLKRAPFHPHPRTRGNSELAA